VDHPNTTSTAKFNLMEKTALKIRHLVEALDEEEICFHDRPTSALRTACKGTSHSATTKTQPSEEHSWCKMR
jgi:hypothetical protein